MPFNARSLVRTGGCPVGSSAAAPSSDLNMIYAFLYGTDDTAAVVEAAGYFNNAAGLVTIGSQLSATMAVSSGTPVCKDYVVTAVPKPGTGNVTIALQASTAG